MIFCTAVNCMDGRTQRPVNEFLRERFAADYVDEITEPGPNGILASRADAATVESILRRVGISVHKHGSGGVAVVGHHDCAGHPVGKDQQIADTLTAATFLASNFPETEVIALWVDENWQVHEIQAGG